MAHAAPVGALFQSPTADVILLSSDGHEFRAHRLFLTEGSGFFRDMFEHPQPGPAHVERVPWLESSAMIDALLRYIYPVEKPVFDTLDAVIPVIYAAVKWQVPSALSTLRQEIQAPRFLATRALRVYGIACDMNWEDVKDIAANIAINTNPMHCRQEADLRELNALEVRKLMALRSARVFAVQHIISCHVRMRCEHGTDWQTDFDLDRFKNILRQEAMSTPTAAIFSSTSLWTSALWLTPWYKQDMCWDQHCEQFRFEHMFGQAKHLIEEVTSSVEKTRAYVGKVRDHEGFGDLEPIGPT